MLVISLTPRRPGFFANKKTFHLYRSPWFFHNGHEQSCLNPSFSTLLAVNLYAGSKRYVIRQGRRRTKWAEQSSRSRITCTIYVLSFFSSTLLLLHTLWKHHFQTAIVALIPSTFVWSIPRIDLARSSPSLFERRVWCCSSRCSPFSWAAVQVHRSSL